ncbi:hypothetical protein EBN03_28700 [Nocardia stercoris]|uniref:Uncharacterized protein n=1 Tax=Nocardia stercoris TaxID=2483361 RepID=A0A3M2KZ64_9NOCA|nr:hypothetical protein EBN03_28700 [Nocardia stercoris]
MREALAAEIGRVDADGLDSCLGPVPEDLTDAEAFHAWLGGHLPLEWVGLRLMAEIFPADDRVELSGRIVVPEGQVRIVDGDVTVDGDLLLEDGARVMVLGTLTITGSLVAPTDSYSLVAAGRIECRDGVTGRTIMALQSIHCPGTFFLSSDHHDSIAPLYTGGVLVDFMWPAQFDRVEVATRVTGGIEEIDYDAAVAALAIPEPEDDDWDDLGSIYAAKLLASVS